VSVTATPAEQSNPEERLFRSIAIAMLFGRRGTPPPSEPLPASRGDARRLFAAEADRIEQQIAEAVAENVAEHGPFPGDEYERGYCLRLRWLHWGDRSQSCRACGQDFVRGSNAQRYCSIECADEGRAGQLRIAAQKRHIRPARRGCEVCGDTFTPKRSDARYCSNACRQDAYRKRKAAV
jgi:hypothetical protein